MQYPTIKHHWYCVTAKTACTITSPSGLNVSLSAGTQTFVYADADSLEITGEATLTQTPGRFSPAPAAAPGGGGVSVPVPVPLDTASPLHHGCVYTVDDAAGALNLGALAVVTHATAEIWLDCTTGAPVSWPEKWIWLDGAAPDFQPGYRYVVVIRNDGHNMIAHAALSYTPIA